MLEERIKVNADNYSCLTSVPISYAQVINTVGNSYPAILEWGIPGRAWHSGTADLNSVKWKSRRQKGRERPISLTLTLEFFLEEVSVEHKLLFMVNSHGEQSW